MPLGAKSAADQYNPLGSQLQVSTSVVPAFLHYYVGVVVWTGLFGNVCCLILYSLRRPALTRLCAVQCLRAATAVDFVFLCSLGVTWLRDLGIDWTNAPAMCGSTIYFANTATFASAWLVTMIASETAAAVARRSKEPTLPNNALEPRWSTVRKITMLCFIGCILNTWTLPGAVGSAALRYYGSKGKSEPDRSGDPGGDTERQNGKASGGPPSCHVDLLKMDMLYGMFAVFDTLVNYALPIASAIILTIWAGCMLRNITAKERRLIMIIDSPGQIGVSHFDGADALLSARDNKDAFALSLAKCVTYLVSTMPLLFYRLWTLIEGKGGHRGLGETAANGFLYAVVYGLFYTQFSCNIVIYCGHALWKLKNGGSDRYQIV